MTIGEKIKEIRTFYSLSVIDFCRKTGLSDTSVYAFEQGKRIPSKKMIMKIVNTPEFGLKPEDLLDYLPKEEDCLTTKEAKELGEALSAGFEEGLSLQEAMEVDLTNSAQDYVDQIISASIEAMRNVISNIKVVPPEEYYNMSLGEMSAWLAGYGAAINDVKKLLTKEDADEQQIEEDRKN